MTQVELAKRLGKTQPHITRIEAGLRQLFLTDFCDWFGALGLQHVEASIAFDGIFKINNSYNDQAASKEST